MEKQTQSKFSLEKYNLQTGFKHRELDQSIYELDFHGFAKPKSKKLFQRTHIGANWISTQKQKGMWLYNRVMLTGPSTQVLARDDANNIIYGINFASADYLGLAQNQKAKEAAIKAATQFGCNSAGSPLAFGATKYYVQLRQELAQYWQTKAVIIYSAGWLAGFGVIKGLIRQYDYVIMDKLSHNCLQEGANAATKNVIKFQHLNSQDMENKLKTVREKDQENAILVVTQGLFSMDSDTPDLNKIQKICKNYDAYLLIDCAHDFGCLGENGRGAWELHGLKDRSNIILLGTGSKTLSTNIGFAACEDQRVIQYLKIFSTAYMFTNAINPIQAATSLANLRILSSEEGKIRRTKVIENYRYLRNKLQAKGYKIFGNQCAILPLRVGNQIVCRLVSRIMMDEGIHVNGIQFPVVSLGEARLRVNLMPQHTIQHMNIFVEKFESALKQATQIYEKSLKKLQQKQNLAQSKL